MDERVNPLVWIVGLIAGGTFLVSRTAEAPGTTGPSAPDAIDAWAREKLARLRADWTQALGRRVREWQPLVLPGIDPTALLGFAANGGRYEDTAMATRDPNRSFHEVGWFGVEAGRVVPLNGGGVRPAVASEPRDPWNHWAQLATHPMVVALLGRNAALGRDAWQAVDDQVAVGLVNLRRHMAQSIAILRPQDRPTQPRAPWSDQVFDREDLVSPWAYCCASAGWSAGDGRWANHVTRWLPAGTPEAGRFGAMARAVADAIAAGHGPTGRKHDNAGYTIGRTWQKLRAGQLLARALGGDLVTQFYTNTLGLGADERRVAELISRAMRAATQRQPRGY